jgi:hypothetical protein
MRVCKKCSQNESLPPVGHSNSHWVWESKRDRVSGGLHYCRKCRTESKRKAWNVFYAKKHLRCVVSRAVNQKLRSRGGSKSGSILKNLPFTIDELKQHLELQFLPGMSWDNYGQWHIDHRVPDSSFTYVAMNDEDFMKSWSLANLQPLWADDNFRKSAKEVY